MLDYLRNVFNYMLCYIVDLELEEELIDKNYYNYISFHSITHELDHLDHMLHRNLYLLFHLNTNIDLHDIM